MTIDAPAKVNLTLRILGKRSDGYHEIETLMAPVSLADRVEISVEEGRGIEFTCSDSTIPCDESNLVCRAVAAFSNHTGLQFRTRLHLEKNIPHGAGLGGGSSDAAATIKALNRLLNTGLAVSELEAIAATLGSDIPFFIRCRPAIARGRGEIVEPYEGLMPADILLVKPPFPVSTPWAYKSFASQKIKMETFHQFHGSIPLMNDLEAPVFNKYIVLPVLKKWLLECPDVSAAMMSGSGSTIFAILKNSALGLESKICAEFGETFQTMRCHLQGLA